MVVSSFILGLIKDLEHRSQRLLQLVNDKVPHTDITQFKFEIVRRLENVNRGVAALSTSDGLQYSELLQYTLFDYQELAQEITMIEHFAVPLILRYSELDHKCFHLVRALTEEAGCPPDLEPKVMATSEQYYWTHPEFHIIGMPVGDLGGVLGWPDIYHEIGHLLLTLWPDFLAQFTVVVNDYFRNERDLIADIGNFEYDNQWLALAQIKWGDSQEGTWRIELACDLIATYLVGPSYGWQHTRLTTNLGKDPYYPCPGQSIADHPADQARLEGIIAMLEYMGLPEEADEIEQNWLDMCRIEGYDQPPQGYDLYYRSTLLESLAEIVFEQCHNNGLVPFTENISCNDTHLGLTALIDKAWERFNDEPITYPEWESRALVRWWHSSLGENQEG